MYNFSVCPWCHVQSVMLQPKTQIISCTVMSKSCEHLLLLSNEFKHWLCSLYLPATNSSTSVKSRKMGYNLCSHGVLHLSSVYWDLWLKDGYHQSSKGVLALTIFYVSFHCSYITPTITSLSSSLSLSAEIASSVTLSTELFSIFLRQEMRFSQQWL